MRLPRSARQTRILVTGFGPFPGVRDNPTQHLVGWIASQDNLTRRIGAHIETEVLPVAWGPLPALLEARLSAADPDIVVHFGYHRAAHGFTVEDKALNRTTSQTDASGVDGAGREVVPGAPRYLRAPSPAAPLVTYLRRRGLSAQPSSDAGRYLCNMLFYLTLDWRRRTGHPRIVHFIHMPSIADTMGKKPPRALTRDEARTGAEAILSYNVARLAAAG